MRVRSLSHLTHLMFLCYFILLRFSRPGNPWTQYITVLYCWANFYSNWFRSLLVAGRCGGPAGPESSTTFNSLPVTARSSDRETVQHPFKPTPRKMSKGEKQHHMVMMVPPPPTAPPPGHQLNMMAPPSYGEAVSGPVPLAGPTVTAPVIQKPLGVVPGMEFGSEPVQLSCWSCHRQVT